MDDCPLSIFQRAIRRNGFWQHRSEKKATAPLTSCVDGRLSIVYPFKLSKASGLFERTIPTIPHVSMSGHSPHAATPFFSAHWRIPQSWSQNTVLTPSTRQPWQLMCSGKMGAWFSAAHNFAVFSRRAWSSWIVAR